MLRQLGRLSEAQELERHLLQVGHCLETAGCLSLPNKALAQLSNRELIAHRVLTQLNRKSSAHKVLTQLNRAL